MPKTAQVTLPPLDLSHPPIEVVTDGVTAHRVGRYSRTVVLSKATKTAKALEETTYYPWPACMPPPREPKPPVWRSHQGAYAAQLGAVAHRDCTPFKAEEPTDV